MEEGLFPFVFQSIYKWTVAVSIEKAVIIIISQAECGKIEPFKSKILIASYKDKFHAKCGKLWVLICGCHKARSQTNAPSIHSFMNILY